MKTALCFGIDNYPNPSDRLNGCVNDAVAWHDFLRNVERFDSVELSTDNGCTRAAMLGRISALVDDSTAGDVLCVTYSGHGTQMPDRSGDEADGMDELWVPWDHRTDGYIVDDDIAAICDSLPADVNLTFFLDMCHAGTATREFSGALVRQLPPDEEMLAVWMGQEVTKSRSTESVYSGKPEVLQAACRRSETAKERGGHGDFTRACMTVLEAGTNGMSNEEFIDDVRAVGSFHQQTPQLWSDPKLWGAGLLQPLTTTTRPVEGCTADAPCLLREDVTALCQRLSS